MKNKLKITFIVLAFLLSINHVFSQSAREIAENASNAIDFPSMEMISTLKIYDAKGRERVRQLAIATRKFDGITKTLIKFTAPADVKGTTMLVFDNEAKDDEESDEVKVTVGKELSRRATVKYGVQTKNAKVIRKVITEYKILEKLLMTAFQNTEGDFGGGM